MCGYNELAESDFWFRGKVINDQRRDHSFRFFHLYKFEFSRDHNIFAGSTDRRFGLRFDLRLGLRLGFRLMRVPPLEILILIEQLSAKKVYLRYRLLFHSAMHFDFPL